MLIQLHITNKITKGSGRSEGVTANTGLCYLQDLFLILQSACHILFSHFNKAIDFQCKALIRHYIQNDPEVLSMCATPAEAPYSPRETPAFTFLWSDLQSPPHWRDMSLTSQCSHASFSEFPRETADSWTCHFLLVQSGKSLPAKAGEIQALCNAGKGNETIYNKL